MLGDDDQPEVVKILLENGANVNLKDSTLNTALHYAAENGNLEIVKLLFEHDVEIDAVNNSKKSAFHLASENEHAEVMIILLRKGANIELPNGESLTALQSAFEDYEPQIEVIEILLRFGANANVKGHNGNPLIQDHDTPDLMKVLFEEAENLNLEIRNKVGQTALEHAFKGHNKYRPQSRDEMKMILYYKCYNFNDIAYH